MGLLLARTLGALSQASYSGTVGTAPVEMVIEADGDGAARAVYVYTRFDTPILLSGRLQSGTLVFTEKNSQGKPSATLTLPGFSPTAPMASGTWKNLATGQTLPLVLTRQSVAGAAPAPELLQAAALKNTYFKAGISSAGGLRIWVYEKKTDRLLQTISVEGQLRGINTVEVGDFNFDGLPEFSVFEQNFAGSNTSRVYFLYAPATRQYVPSGFGGVSLEFDAKAKRIYETNSCCAGSSVQQRVYKVVKNSMVQVVEHCYKWDPKTKKMVERPVSACQ